MREIARYGARQTAAQAGRAVVETAADGAAETKASGLMKTILVLVDVRPDWSAATY
jgi:hypothetical protein